MAEISAEVIMQRTVSFDQDEVGGTERSLVFSQRDDDRWDISTPTSKRPAVTAQELREIADALDAADARG